MEYHRNDWIFNNDKENNILISSNATHTPFEEYFKNTALNSSLFFNRLSSCFEKIKTSNSLQVS